MENNGKGIECLPGIHANEEDLKRLAVFRQLKEKFMDLSNDQKICLLSLAVFPENQEVNRTMLMYLVDWRRDSPCWSQTRRCGERHSQGVHGEKVD